MANSNILFNPNNNSTLTLIPILIIAGLVLIFGFVFWINRTLIPYMKKINRQ